MVHIIVFNWLCVHPRGNKKQVLSHHYARKLIQSITPLGFAEMLHTRHIDKAPLLRHSVINSGTTKAIVAFTMTNYAGFARSVSVSHVSISLITPLMWPVSDIGFRRRNTHCDVPVQNTDQQALLTCAYSALDAAINVICSKSETATCLS